MIWKTKKPLDAEELKAYSAPSMLRHFKENKWRTTNQSTYQNYFQGNKMAAKSLKDGVREEVGTGRDNMLGRIRIFEPIGFETCYILNTQYRKLIASLVHVPLSMPCPPLLSPFPAKLIQPPDHLTICLPAFHLFFS